MKNFKFYLIALSLIYAENVFAQRKKNNTELLKLKTEVDNFKDYKSNIDSYAKAAIQKTEVEVNEKVQAKLDEFVKAEWGLWILVAVGLPTTIVAAYQMLWGIKKRTNKLIQEKIETIVERNREDILRVVETEMFDNGLRNNKKLLVIGADAESNKTITTFLEQMKFKNIVTRIAGRDENLPAHDLIIFNTPGGEVDQEIINGFLEGADVSDTYFVAYSRIRLEPHAHLNFASSKITLYHNILQTLKYKEIVKVLEN